MSENGAQSFSNIKVHRLFPSKPFVKAVPVDSPRPEELNPDKSAKGTDEYFGFLLTVTSEYPQESVCIVLAREIEQVINQLLDTASKLNLKILRISVIDPKNHNAIKVIGFAYYDVGLEYPNEEVIVLVEGVSCLDHPEIDALFDEIVRMVRVRAAYPNDRVKVKLMIVMEPRCLAALSEENQSYLEKFALTKEFV